MSCSGVENKVMNGQQQDNKSLADIRENDVVCEKGRGHHEKWPGNKRYRYLVTVNKESYNNNDLTLMERSEVIGKIITTIQDKSGWFVQLDEESGGQCWTRISEDKVRRKVSDDLRRAGRRDRAKRSNNTAFCAKLKELKQEEEGVGAAPDSLNKPVEDPQETPDILKPVEDPRETDVLFGAGARRHPGNITYWKLIHWNLDQDTILPYGGRPMISKSIVEGIRDQKGRFLEQDVKTALWFEISEQKAIDKTSHLFSQKKYNKARKPPPGTEHHPSTSKTLEALSGQDQDARE
jgi:hypothetical protein